MFNIAKYFLYTIFYIYAFTANADLLDSIKNVKDDIPVTIEADQLNYDKNKQKISATGKVEIIQDERKLTADKLTYDQKENNIKASGNIILKEPDGTILYASEVDLYNKLKSGNIKDFRSEFTNGAFMKAQNANRDINKITTLKNAIYSACPVCKDENNKIKSDPLWQVRSNKTIIDENEAQITYHNAFFDIYGVPVLYTPYLSHPMNNAKRKSGFLTPKYKSDSNFGFSVSLPYYWNIAENKDLTLTSKITAKENISLLANYRSLLKNGYYEFNGSITYPENKIRGHIDSFGKFDLNDKWNAGFIVKRSTDDTYLKKYEISEEDVLVSKLYTNYINNNDYKQKNTSYADIEFISFQGLNADDYSKNIPLILPNANFHFAKKLNYLKGLEYIADSNLFILKRDEGSSTKRISIDNNLKLPYIHKSGNLFNFSLGLRGDLYHITNNDNYTDNDYFVSRVIPKAEFKWSLPLLKQNLGRTVIIEPMAKIIVTPYGKNSNKIVNEDSLGIEFSDENLFSSNHFTGLDLVENGPRVNYGINSLIKDNKFGDFNFIFGQIYSIKENNDFSGNSGLDQHFSDFVGHILYKYKDYFTSSYKFRLNKDNYNLDKNSINFSLNLDKVNLGLDYISIQEDNTNDDRELIKLDFTTKLIKDFIINANIHRNLEIGKWVSTGTKLIYKADCVDVVFGVKKEFTKDRDAKSNTTFSLQILLKTFNTN